MGFGDNLAMLRAYFFFDDTDKRITENMRQYSEPLLRYSLGIIFIWFGALKIFGYSPATELVARTVYWADPFWFVSVLRLVGGSHRSLLSYTSFRPLWYYDPRAADGRYIPAVGVAAFNCVHIRKYPATYT